ncbi:hypothetical protein QF001_002858 [Paraburkholderia youngii]
MAAYGFIVSERGRDLVIAGVAVILSTATYSIHRGFVGKVNVWWNELGDVVTIGTRLYCCTIGPAKNLAGPLPPGSETYLIAWISSTICFICGVFSYFAHTGWVAFTNAARSICAAGMIVAPPAVTVFCASASRAVHNC